MTCTPSIKPISVIIALFLLSACSDDRPEAVKTQTIKDRLQEYYTRDGVPYMIVDSLKLTDLSDSSDGLQSEYKAKLKTSLRLPEYLYYEAYVYNDLQILYELDTNSADFKSSFFINLDGYETDILIRNIGDIWSYGFEEGGFNFTSLNLPYAHYSEIKSRKAFIDTLKLRYIAMCSDEEQAIWDKLIAEEPNAQTAIERDC